MLKKMLAAFRVNEVRKQWELTREKLSVLEEQYIIETRGEERFRIEKLISQLKEERQLLEQELLQIEAQLGEALFSPTEGVASDGQDTPQWPATPWWVSLFTGRKLRYIVLLLILGVGAWGTVELLPVYWERSASSTQSRKTTLTPEQKIDKLKDDLSRLQIKRETLDLYPSYLPEIRERAPSLARQFLNVSDEEMDTGHKISKYEAATYAFKVAAEVENGETDVKEYIEQGIKAAGTANELIDEAIKNSSTSNDEYDREVEEWIRENNIQEYITYILAQLYIIKAKKLHDSTLDITIQELINDIPDRYKEKYPLETDPNFKWYLDQPKTKQGGENE